MVAICPSGDELLIDTKSETDLYMISVLYDCYRW